MMMELKQRYKLWIGSGSRNHRKPEPIKKALLYCADLFGYPDGYFHGNARGFDTYSDLILRRIGFSNIKKFDADWDQYGKIAGILRNVEMLEQGLTFYDKCDILVTAMPLETSKGTYRMIEATQERGIDFLVFNQEGNRVES